jgi:ELWxxDGT repeat protein
MVKDIVPGSDGSYPEGFVESNGRSFFITSIATEEFWTSDGTEAGTFKLSDIYPEFSNYSSNHTDLNGRLFFMMQDPGSGAEPWIFDSFGPKVCDNNIEVNIGQTYFGNTDIAAGTDISSCAADDPNDVWYTFTPPHDGQYTFTLEGSNFDTSLAVYSNCPASAETEIACNDNYDPNTYSQLTVTLADNDDAFIRIAGTNQANGEYELTVVGCKETFLADLNGDCEVNLADVALMSFEWLSCNRQPQEFCNP